MFQHVVFILKYLFNRGKLFVFWLTCRRVSSFSLLIFSQKETILLSICKRNFLTGCSKVNDISFVNIFYTRGFFHIFYSNVWFSIHIDKLFSTRFQSIIHYILKVYKQFLIVKHTRILNTPQHIPNQLCLYVNWKISCNHWIYITGCTVKRVS